MKTTIEIPDGLLKEGETLEYRAPLKGERFLGSTFRLATAEVDLTTHFPVIIPPFNKEEWANTNLPIPRKECWTAMDEDGRWWYFNIQPAIKDDFWDNRRCQCLGRIDYLMKDTEYPADWKDSLFHFNGERWHSDM